MFPKATKIGFGEEFWFEKNPPPILQYANADFHDTTTAIDEAVLWVQKYLGDRWDDARIRTYLDDQQILFRSCLEGLLNGAVVDVRGNLGADAEEENFESRVWRRLWSEDPAVHFFREHALEHAGILLSPAYQDGGYFGGLTLAQGKAKDPFDPICWYLLWRFMFHGGIPFRCCPRCLKIFEPPTARRIYCSSSCRALDREANIKLGPDVEDVQGPNEGNAYQNFLERRKNQMRRYRQLPQVKRRVPGGHE